MAVYTTRNRMSATKQQKAYIYQPPPVPIAGTVPYGWQAEEKRVRYAAVNQSKQTKKYLHGMSPEVVDSEVPVCVMLQAGMGKKCNEGSAECREGVQQCPQRQVGSHAQNRPEYFTRRRPSSKPRAPEF